MTENDHLHSAIELAKKGDSKTLELDFGKNRKALLTAVKLHPELIQFCEEFKRDFAFCFEAVSIDGLVIKYLDLKFLMEEEFLCFAAFDQNPDSIIYLPKNKEVANHVLKTHPQFIKHFEDLLNNLSYRKEIFSEFPETILYVPFDISLNPFMAITAIKGGLSLKKYTNISTSHNYASKNYEICLEAVKNNGMEYEYVLLRDHNNEKDLDIALEAVKQNPKSIKLFSSDIRGKMDIHFAIDHACKGQPRFLKNYTSDREIMLKAVKKKGKLLSFCDKWLKSDFEICLEAVMNDGMALEFVDKNFLKNEEVLIIAAFDNQPSSFKYSPIITETIVEHILKSKNPHIILNNRLITLFQYLIEKLLPKYPFAIEYMTSLYQRKRENILCAIENGYSLQKLLNFNDRLEYLSKDQEICLTAVKNNGLDYACVNFHDPTNEFDVNIAIEAVKQNKNAYKLMGSSFQKNMHVQYYYYINFRKLTPEKCHPEIQFHFFLK